MKQVKARINKRTSAAGGSREIVEVPINNLECWLHKDTILAVRGDEVVGVLTVRRLVPSDPSTPLIATDLEANGDLTVLLRGIRAIKDAASAEPIYLGIRTDHPRHDQLVRLYKRYGAIEGMTMMQFGGNT